MISYLIAVYVELQQYIVVYVLYILSKCGR